MCVGVCSCVWCGVHLGKYADLSVCMCVCVCASMCKCVYVGGGGCVCLCVCVYVCVYVSGNFREFEKPLVRPQLNF